MKVYEKLDEKIIAFIEKQKMFFVATAPLSGDGHINLSPKGYDAFKVIDGTTVAWLDLGGSGIETQAHVQENGRITIMFCAFEGPANILRLFGTGEVINPHHAAFDEMLALFPGFDRARGIFRVKLTRIQDSCGWGVPFYEFKSERDQLNRYIDNKSKEEWLESRYTKNAESIDGLPGMVKDSGENL
ncbi:MAG: pyridoxamine 5'-phosphate oxidase family protein [Henriciella sp.]